MDDDYVAMRDAIETLEERLYRSEALNAELARMLKSLEWKSGGQYREDCHVCGAMKIQGIHAPDCALDALLKKAIAE